MQDGFIYPQLSLELARKGIATLRFDFSGNGESQVSLNKHSMIIKRVQGEGADLAFDNDGHLEDVAHGSE